MGRKALKRKLGKKVLAGKLTVGEARARLGREMVQRVPEFGEGMESLDLVRIGADGSPHWTRIWPTPEDNSRHARLELWMAAYGYQIVSGPAGAFDWCEGEDD